MSVLKKSFIFLSVTALFVSADTGVACAQDSYSYTAARQANTNQFPQSETRHSNSKSLLLVELKELNRIKGVYFMFSDKSLNKKNVNKISDKSGDVENTLDRMLLNTGLAYKKINNSTFVILQAKEGETTNLETQVSNSKIEPLIVSKFMFAQTENIVTGKVTNETDAPVTNVSVIVKGTKRGTSTNASGLYSIDAAKGDILVFSSVGYQAQELVVSSSNNIAVKLVSAISELNTVVVTALGIKKERRSLGYSVTEVKGSDLTEAREINIANSLVGKVAGLNVSSVAGGPGSSTNVIIRGISSLGGSNQPLYVINGVPMESAPNGQAGTQYDNGIDRGDAIGNINPDDIETISVLKGAAASALYGYRAKAGVILITTKSAKGNGIEFNSNYVSEMIMDPTDWQYVYGQGANNVKPADQVAAFQTGQSSWGGKLDGSNAVQFDGVSRPYIAKKDNLENFYRTGGTFTNTLSFNKTFTGGGLRFSASTLSNNAVIPSSGLDRQSFNFSGNFNPIPRLVMDARANYILEQAKNRPFLSDGAGNANYNVMFLPTSVDVNVLEKTSNDDGSEYSYSANSFATNPWFAARKFINNTSRERLISSASARYNFDNGFFLQGRVGRDSYNDRYTGVVPTGTAYRVKGQITEESIKFTDLNVDGLMGITFNVKDNLSITPNIGASYRRTKSEKFTNNGSDFSVPFVYNILNAQNKSVAYDPSDIEVQSLYGTLEFAYNSYLYITGSARSDWFSTLATPGAGNKLNVVYPSLSGSFVFSEFVKNKWLDFGKLRAGYAVVGQATGPYQTQLSYTFNSVSLNGRPLGSILNSNVPNKSLRPSKASEFEVGTELRMFKNKVGLDITYYNKISKDEIIFAPASISSGYNGAVLNIGELQNKGFEALLSVDVVKTTNFRWRSSVNGSINDNKVISLAAEQGQLAGGTSRSGVGFTASVVGLPAAQVMAFDYKYDDAGKLQLDANGIPARGALIPMGSAYHKWIGGWSNELNFKNFNLSFLIDGKWGGKIFSATDYYGYVLGLHKATLVDREKNFGTTAVPVYSSTYYSTLANNVSRLFVQDASFIKFRQLAVGYTFPSKMFNNVVKSLNLSLVGRNLFTIMKKTDNIDPEGNFTSTSSGLTQGLELGGVPPVRSIGINLNVKF